MIIPPDLVRGGARHSGAPSSRRASRTLGNRPAHQGRRAHRCLIDDLAVAGRRGQDRRMLQDCPRHHEGQAGRGRAAAKRATAGTRSGARQDAPVDQHAPDLGVDAGVPVRADSRRGDGTDGVRFCQRPDARRRPGVAEAPRVEEFPPRLRGVLATGRGWGGEHLQQGAQRQRARRGGRYRGVRIHGRHAGSAGVPPLRHPRRAIDAAAIAIGPASRHDLDALADAASPDRRGLQVLRRARPAGRGSDRAHPRRRGAARKRGTLPRRSRTPLRS